MARVTRKIAASTLIEVIVALVILVLCMGLSFTLFTQMYINHNPQTRLQAIQHIQRVAAESLATMDMEDNTWQWGNITLEKRVQDYEPAENLAILELVAFNRKGRKIYVYRRVVPKNTSQRLSLK